MGYYTPAKVDRDIQPKAFPGSCAPVIGVELADAFGDGQIKFQRFFEVNFDVETLSVLLTERRGLDWCDRTCSYRMKTSSLPVKGVWPCS
jgi:hypothetical protein